MGEKSFTITFDGSATLTVDEVWPDGDAPANPTLLDVMRAIRKSTFSESDLIEKWNLSEEILVHVGDGADSLLMDWHPRQ
jgi:hypothetical protein